MYQRIAKTPSINQVKELYLLDVKLEGLPRRVYSDDSKGAKQGHTAVIAA